ncbi:MAG: caspase family protein [Candidatus Poribacteria bacterium]|nr:caspase family protein [Candidatus Poribacteria bacterium]
MFTRYSSYILLSGVLYSMILGGAQPVVAENWALLVGIDDYKMISPDLRFCESDAKRMREAIVKYADFKSENIKMLLGSEATKKNIRKTIKQWLINNVKHGDKMFFYFSGHGVQIPDPTNREEDGKDELLCAYDSARHSYTFIRDNELGKWMDQIQTDEKIVILDCCHSGTATRGMVSFGEESDNVPRVKAYYPDPTSAIRESTLDEIKTYDPEITEAELADAGTRAVGGDQGGETSISGCRDDQVSLESPAVEGGVLTNYIIESLRSRQTDANGDGVVTVHELWTETRKRIQKKGWQQDPQYYGNDKVAIIGRFMDTTGEEPDPPESEIGTAVADYHGQVTQVSEDSIQLSIGSDDGVTRGSIYAVKTPAGEGKVQLRISAVKPTMSYAQRVEGSEAIRVGDSVVEERHFVESEDLLLLIESIKPKDNGAKTVARQLTERVKQEVQKLSNVKLVDANQAPDRILAGTATSSGGRFEVSLRLINVNIGNSTQAHTLQMRADQVDAAAKTFFTDHEISAGYGESQRVEGFASLIRASYVLKALVKLENPKPGFAINVTLDKGDLATYDIGETVEISMEPERDCYVYVLDIGSSGKINLLFPSEFEPNNFLKKGQKYTIPSTDAYAIELSGPPGEERVKVIATAQKIPLDRLNPENMDSPIKTYVTSAPALLQLSMKDLSLKPRNTWATETVLFTVGNPQVYATRDPLELGALE